MNGAFGSPITWSRAWFSSTITNTCFSRAFALFGDEAAADPVIANASTEKQITPLSHRRRVTEDIPILLSLNEALTHRTLLRAIRLRAVWARCQPFLGRGVQSTATPPAPVSPSHL